MEEVWLYNYTWEEVAEKRESSNGVIILPIGSTEQHGFHLPLGNDTLLAISLAKAAAATAGVLVAPPLWFGWSPHHMVLPGTISIRAEVLTEVLYDIVKSLACHGWKGFVLVNGHRVVNIPWMQIAAERAQRELGVRVVLFDPAYMSKEIVDQLGFGPMAHAGEIETSHLWHCYPHLVKMDHVIDCKLPPQRLYHLDPRTPSDTLCYVPATVEHMKKVAEETGGTTGCPSKSCPEKGKKYHEYLVNRLVQVVEELKV